MVTEVEVGQTGYFMQVNLILYPNQIPHMIQLQYQIITVINAWLNVEEEEKWFAYQRL